MGDEFLELILPDSVISVVLYRTGLYGGCSHNICERYNLRNSLNNSK